MKEAIIQYNDDPNADGNHMIISWKKLIRCKDCKKRNQHHECEYGYHSDDWFCADGDPKD